MKKTLNIIKSLFYNLLKLLVLLLFKINELLFVRGVVIFLNEEKKNLNIFKYKRIKKSIKYKLWFWNNMRWLCKLCNLNFSPYNKFYKNNIILKY